METKNKRSAVIARRVGLVLAGSLGLAMLAGTASAAVWKKINKAGPSDRYGYGLVFDSAKKLVLLYGGRAGTGGELNDFWKWNGSAWTELDVVPVPGDRHFHAMAYDANRKKTVFFGGWKSGWGNPYQDDTWEWNGASWKEITKPGPSGREKAAMVYDSKRKRVVLFGGYDGNDRLNDTWAYTSAGWKKIAAAGPPGLLNHAMAYDAKRDRIVLFGGYSDAGYNGTTWLFNGAKWVKSAAKGPSARSSASLCFSANGNVAVLFGGRAGNWPDYTSLKDTWVWNGTRWTQLKIAGPSARSDHRMAYHSASGQVLMFGGDDPESWSALDDTWLFKYK